LSERVISTEQGQKMADGMGAPFLETSAKDDYNVTQAFHTIAADIKKKFIDGQ